LEREEKMRVQIKNKFAAFAVGNRVQIRESERSPYSGQCGVVSSVDLTDGRAPYLVHFEDGMQFRYKAEEFVSPYVSAGHPLLDRLVKSRLYKILALNGLQVLSPSTTQPRFDSVPPRFGTRQ
jgi:hypothetical protein